MPRLGGNVTSSCESLHFLGVEIPTFLVGAPLRNKCPPTFPTLPNLCAAQSLFTRPEVQPARVRSLLSLLNSTTAVPFLPSPTRATRNSSRVNRTIPHASLSTPFQLARPELNGLSSLTKPLEHVARGAFASPTHTHTHQTWQQQQSPPSPPPSPHLPPSSTSPTRQPSNCANPPQRTTTPSP